MTRGEMAAIVERGFFEAPRCMAPSQLASGDARLDALHSAPNFDEAVNAALAAGLEVYGGTEASEAGRHVVVVDPNQPEVVLASIGDDAQVPTSGGPNLRAQGAAWATCGVSGTDAHVAMYPDGKVRGITGRYTIRYDVCRSGWNCRQVTAATEGAVRETDSAGGAKSAILFGSRIVVTSAALGARTLADASVVSDWLGRKTCTVRLNNAHADITSALARWNAADRDLIQSTMTHEIGHCLGLHHAAGGAPLVMAAWGPTRPGLGATDPSAPRDHGLLRLDRGLNRSLHVGRWLFRFVMMVDGLLGGNHASKAPPGGLLFLFAAVVGFTLAAVSVSAMG